eukprot:2949660-Pleurochrysis_carterae.AAC.1
MAETCGQHGWNGKQCFDHGVVHSFVQLTSSLTCFATLNASFGVVMRARPAELAKQSSAGLRSMRDACTTRVGFALSAIPRACDP